MPSLHVTWAFVLAWHAARTGILAGLFGFVFLVLTILATLALGEHYLIDLVLAAPLATAILAAIGGQKQLALTGFLLTAAMLTMIRLVA
jgi:hypothetical protein